MNNQVAVQKSISDVIEEYQAKVSNVDNEIQAFKDAVSALESSSVVAGQYGHGIWYRGAPSISASTVKKSLLISAWRHIYHGLNIDKIAPAKDKKLFEQKFENPPEFTIPNIREMFGDYIVDPFFHVLRGLAEVFTDLDPAYKSHSKVKIGVKGLPKRVIIENVVNGYGSHGETRLKNMLDALRVYRGEALMEYKEFREITESLSRRKEHEHDGMRFKPYANGNCHVYFNEERLLEINRALSKFYGDVLPDAEDEKPTKKRASTAVSKDLQYYPTPQKVIDTILSDENIASEAKVLEPSCGCGRILDAVSHADAFGIEYDGNRAAEARAKGHNVLKANFLEVEPVEEYDFVIMNPPFYGKHYLKHIEHAMKFLKPGGTLISVLPASAWYDHEDVKKIGSYRWWRDLPLASFKESGTNVCTGYVKIRK